MLSVSDVVNVATRRSAYLCPMPKSTFEPCIPTKAAKVPDLPEWIHEIKRDGYRRAARRQARAAVHAQRPRLALPVSFHRPRIGGFGAQLQSFQWRHPVPSEERRIAWPRLPPLPQPPPVPVLVDCLIGELAAQTANPPVAVQPVIGRAVTVKG